MSEDKTPSHPVFAAIYDPVMEHAEDSLLREIRESLVEDMKGTVLDLGAGTGAMFPYFKRATDQELSLTLHAIEPDPHMRRRAVQKADELNLDIAIQPEGAQSLPYADDSVDVIIASLVFCTIPDVDAALSEVARVLKSNGEFRFLEHVQADGWLAHVQTAVNPVWRLGAAGCNLDRDTATTFKNDDRFDVIELEELSIGVPPVAPFVRGALVPR
ncbi:class I SAM-dependent methyltransferase [Halorhabdus rudnickae]|uniref:class I SAM-dependent methyltransferase n=1 Tax=Halorhabdus rudnickae TaxID=1775544 RepID=UPI0010831478|nr:class I SAM-dependent methyltransferase [Halorhabdus rudnickae]